MDYPSLLSTMSDKFNQGSPESVAININEDNTLKWRGLQSNRYAAKRKRNSTKVNDIETKMESQIAQFSTGNEKLGKSSVNKISRTSSVSMDSIIENGLHSDMEKNSSDNNKLLNSLDKNLTDNESRSLRYKQKDDTNSGTENNTFNEQQSRRKMRKTNKKDMTLNIPTKMTRSRNPGSIEECELQSPVATEELPALAKDYIKSSQNTKKDISQQSPPSTIRLRRSERTQQYQIETVVSKPARPTDTKDLNAKTINMVGRNSKDSEIPQNINTDDLSEQDVKAIKLDPEVTVRKTRRHTLSNMAIKDEISNSEENSQSAKSTDSSPKKINLMRKTGTQSAIKLRKRVTSSLPIKKSPRLQKSNIVESAIARKAKVNDVDEQNINTRTSRRNKLIQSKSVSPDQLTSHQKIHPVDCKLGNNKQVTREYNFRTETPFHNNSITAEKQINESENNTINSREYKRKSDPFNEDKGTSNIYDQDQTILEKEQHLETLGLCRAKHVNNVNLINNHSDTEMNIRKLRVRDPNEMLRPTAITGESDNNELTRTEQPKVPKFKIGERIAQYDREMNGRESETTVTPLNNETQCLCNKPSKYYINSNHFKYCTAIDEIEQQHIGCNNEIEEDLPYLFRSSVRVSYGLYCYHHKKRFYAHDCCPGCGIFCTSGMFVICPKKHFFHRECALKYVLNTSNDSTNETSLMIKCPHCGEAVRNGNTKVRMKCSIPPVFLPTESCLQIKSTKSSEKSIHLYEDDSRERNKFRIDIEKLIPREVLQILNEAMHSESDNVPFSSNDIFCAVHMEELGRVAEIVGTGYDVLTPSPEFNDGTCLHLVASSGNITMVYLILSRATSLEYLDILDNDGRSALMCSVVFNKCDILNLLIKCGANLHLQDNDGMTALHLAAKDGNLEAIEIIINHYKNFASAGDYQTLINAVDNGNWTALAWAVNFGHLNVVRFLLNCDAATNIFDHDNNTVLHWSSRLETTEILLSLLTTNCDPNIQNSAGDTALHFAGRCGKAEAALLLLAHGANLDIPNNAGDTVLDIVSNTNNLCAKVINFNSQIRKVAGTRFNKIISQDISNGREMIPIKMIRSERCFEDENEQIDEPSFPDFKYITKTILQQNAIQIDLRISQMRICNCSDNCTGDGCECIAISSHNWYNIEGRLHNDFNYNDPVMIFECNDVCSCNKKRCKNRVVQNGIKIPLQVFECPDIAKGWGVRPLTKIIKGSFIAEYTGEILTDSEADRRTDDSYFFDLDNHHCIDSNYYGNVTRFFNHSCDPNVVPVRVFYDHQDLRFPKIAFFALRDIASGEEITFDYGEKFWIVKCKSFACQCRAKNCRYNENAIADNMAMRD